MHPDFLIIGAQRSGSTSLFENLIKHPNVLPSNQKEIHFFDLNYDKGFFWYQSQFKSKKVIQNDIEKNKKFI